MLRKYTPLFQIDLRHSYFTDGNCRELAIQPTSISQQLMRAYDIRLQLSNEGVKVYQGFEAIAGSEALSRIDTPMVLTFLLTNNDPLFANYTQLDLFDQRNTKLFFSNTLPSEADGVIPISPANIVSFTSFQPSIQFSPPAEYTSLTVSLYTIAGEKILEKVLNPEDAATGTFQLVLPDEIADEGELLLNLETEDGQVQEQSLYVHSNQARLDTLVGVLQIAVYPSVAQALLNSQGPVYQLDFSARETIWRYHFISTATAFEQFKLFKNGKALTEVRGPEAVQIPGGQMAQVMTLQSPIALQERPGDKIELEASGSSQSPIKLQLPSPDANRITPGKDENGQQVFYSDMYVYL